MADNTDDFEQIGAAFEVAVGLSVGQVGDAEARLMQQRALVDFAADWMAEHGQRRGFGVVLGPVGLSWALGLVNGAGQVGYRLGSWV